MTSDQCGRKIPRCRSSSHDTLQLACVLCTTAYIECDPLPSSPALFVPLCPCALVPSSPRPETLELALLSAPPRQKPPKLYLPQRVPDLFHRYRPLVAQGQKDRHRALGLPRQPRLKLPQSRRLAHFRQHEPHCTLSGVRACRCGRTLKSVSHHRVVGSAMVNAFFSSSRQLRISTTAEAQKMTATLGRNHHHEGYPTVRPVRLVQPQTAQQTRAGAHRRNG